MAGASRTGSIVEGAIGESAWAAPSGAAASSTQAADAGYLVDADLTGGPPGVAIRMADNTHATRIPKWRFMNIPPAPSIRGGRANGSRRTSGYTVPSGFN